MGIVDLKAFWHTMHTAPGRFRASEMLATTELRNQVNDISLKLSARQLWPIEFASAVDLGHSEKIPLSSPPTQQYAEIMGGIDRAKASSTSGSGLKPTKAIYFVGHPTFSCYCKELETCLCLLWRKRCSASDTHWLLSVHYVCSCLSALFTFYSWVDLCQNMAVIKRCCLQCCFWLWCSSSAVNFLPVFSNGTDRSDSSRQRTVFT